MIFVIDQLFTDLDKIQTFPLMNEGGAVVS